MRTQKNKNKHISKKLPYSKPIKPKQEENFSKGAATLNLLDLNDDCLIAIFEFLPKQDLFNLERVCKHFRKICLSVWKRVHVLNLREDFKFDDLCPRSKRIAMKELLWRCQDSVKHMILPKVDCWFSPRSALDLIYQYCPNVTHLDIEFWNIECRVCRAIPPAFAQNLKSLGLSIKNFLDKEALSILFKKAKNLEELKFAFRDMYSLLCVLPKNIRNLSLTFTYSDFTTRIDVTFEQAIGNLSNLQNLSLRSNTIGGSIASVSNQLISLSFPGSPQFFEDNLHKLTFHNLKKLSLVECGNLVEDSVIFHLSEHAPLLEHLNLGGCAKLTDVGFHYLENLSKLKFLNVRKTFISGSVFETLALRLNALENIICSFCVNVTDVNLSGMVTFFPNLRVLDVEMEKVTEEFFESSMKSLMPGLNGKRRKLALYVYDNLITSSVKYAVDKSEGKQQNEMLLKIKKSDLFELHMYGEGKDAWGDNEFF